MRAAVRLLVRGLDAGALAFRAARTVGGLILTSSLLAGLCQGEDAIAIDVPQRNRPVDFSSEIAPILRANCVACHLEKKASGGLVLESPKSLLKGGESGPAVVAGKADASLLLKVAAHQDQPVMPPPDNTVGARPLTPAQLGLLKLWIDQGATGSLSARRMVQWQPLPAGYQPALAAAVTPDGQFVVFSRGNRLLVHHRAGNQATNLVDPDLKNAAGSSAECAHHDLIRSLAFDAAGDRLASGSFREVKLWRRPRVVPMAEWSHEAALQSVAASPNGQWGATGDETGRVRLWQLASGKSVHTIAAHPSAVSGIVFSPDSSTLYTGGARSVRAWNVATGQPLGKGIETASPIRALALANQGDWLVTGGEDGVARVWDAKQVREAAETLPPLREIKAHTGEIAALAELPGHLNQFLSAGADGLVRRWDAQSGQSIRELRNEGPAVALAASPDGRSIAVASASAVTLFDSDGKQIAQWKTDPRQAAKIARMDAGITFTRTAIAQAQQDLKSYEGLIRIAKVRMDDVKKAEDELAKVQKTRDEKKAALEKARSENGKVEPAEKALADAETAVVVAGTVIERARAIAERTARELAEAEQAVAAREELLKQQQAARDAAETAARTESLAIRSLTFSAEGGRLVSGGESGVLHIFDAAGIWLESRGDHQGPVRAVCASNGKLITVSADRRGLVWNAPGQWQLERVIGGSATGAASAGSAAPDPLVDRVLSVDFSRDGRLLATGGGIPSRSGELKIWNVETGQLVREIQDAHTETIFAVRFSPAGDQVASASGDRFVRIFDVPSGRLVRQLQGHTGPVQCLAWKSDGTQLISGGADNVLKLWNVATGLPLRTMKGTTYRIGAYKRDITAVAFIGDSEQILAASGDGTVRLHRTTSDNDILTFTGSKGYQHSVAATPDGRTVLSTSSDGTIQIWSGHEPQPKLTLRP